MTKHVHHDLIVKWAADTTLEIEYYNPEHPCLGWTSCASSPRWNLKFKYRIKPRLVKKEGWIALHGSNSLTGIVKYVSHVYATKEEAKLKYADNCVAIKIEWEEEEQV